MIILLSWFVLAAGLPQMDMSPEEAMRFIANLEDNVSIHLTDETFEHETQAATGATTGDWFVYFYDKNCHACTMFKAVWRFFAKKVNEDEDLYVNVAKVDIDESPETVRRFKLYSFPSLVYFHKGQYYVIPDKRDEYEL